MANEYECMIWHEHEWLHGVRRGLIALHTSLYNTSQTSSNLHDD